MHQQEELHEEITVSSLGEEEVWDSIKGKLWMWRTGESTDMLVNGHYIHGGVCRVLQILLQS